MKSVPLGIVALVSLLSPGYAGAQPVDVVSRADPSLFSATGGGRSSVQAHIASVNADGRFVVFSSLSPNLVASQVDENAAADVFLRDRVAGTTTLVSHAAGAPLTAAGGNSHYETISADGAWVAFASSAANLVAGTDTNSASDVFLFEVSTGLVTLVSHVPGSPLMTANGLSISPVLSADGGQLAFMSQATNLVAGTDPNPEHDVFLYDRSTGGVTLVSHAFGSPTTASQGSDPVLSRDGAFVAFLSPGTDLVSGPDNNFDYDVFLYERATGLVSLVSHAAAAANQAGNFYSTGPIAIDDYAGLVAFPSAATDLVPGTDSNLDLDVFVYGRSSGALSLVSHAEGAPTTTGNGMSFYPTLDGAGAFLGFESGATDLLSGIDSNGTSDVFLLELGTGALRLVSRSAGAPTQAGNAGSFFPLLSRSANTLSFTSLATDLVAGTDTNARSDTFLHERVGNVNVLVSHKLGSESTAAAGESFDGSMSDDGITVALWSTAPDVVAQDYNSGPFDGADVFVFQPLALNELVSARDTSLPGITSNASSSLFGSSSAIRRGSRVSGDGRFVAFHSLSANLVANQVRQQLGFQVFLSDRQTGSMVLVSHAPGLLATTCDGTAQDPVLSRDGRYVAFQSDADLLGTGGTPGVLQVFLYDRISGVTQLVSHAIGAPTTGANGGSTLASISADGARVGFASAATDLVVGTDTNSLDDAFVFETATGAVTLVSHALGSPNDAGNGLSFAPVLAGGGGYAAFASFASDLVSGSDTNGQVDVFLFDCVSGAVSLVSHVSGAPGSAGNAGSNEATVSDDGTYVGFTSYATDLLPGVGPGNVFFFERTTGDLVLCSHAAGLPTTGGNSGSERPSIAGGGTAIAFESQATDLVPGSDVAGTTDVFECDRLTGSVVLASHVPADPEGAGNDISFGATISGDGSSVAFLSEATDLVGGPDGNQSTDAFLYDRSTGTVRLVSHRAGAPTTAGNLQSFDNTGPMLSDAGAHVAFSSFASDLITGDFNFSTDVFVYGPQGPTIADLSVSKSDGQATAVPGESITYVMAVANAGPGDAGGVVVTDTLPAELTGASWSCLGVNGGFCYSPGGSGNISLLADMPVGSSIGVTLIALVDAAATGTLTNTVSAALPGGATDPNMGNNTASDADALTPEADLGVAQSDTPDPVPVGQNVTYTVTATNNGPSQAAGGSLTDTLPAGTSLVSVLPGPPTCNTAAGVVTCSLPSLAPGAADLVEVTVQTSVVGGITNVAAVTGTSPDPLSFNNVSSESGLVVNRPPGELVHGSVEVRDLAPASSPTTGPDLYRLRQEPVASYQVVVDAATGDIGSGSGPTLDRVEGDGATVIQSSVAAGAGGSRSLAWQNAQTVVEDEQYVRVASAGCAPCGPQDTYRIRAWETTLSGARFNNSASQVTVLVLENATASQVFGYVWFREGSGPILNFDSFLIPPRGTFVLNTASLVPGVAGSVVVTHIAPYGGLGGKLVSVEPATGFTFDTPLSSRPR